MNKHLIPILLSSMVVTSLSFADELQNERKQHSEKIQQAYNKGIALKAFDPDQAALHFKEVLQLQPRHSKAQYELNYIRTHRDKILKEKQSRQVAASFKKMRFAVVDFSQEPLVDVIDTLYAYMDRDYGVDHGVNLILKDPQGKIRQKLVTLRLKNIPAPALLDYIVQQAGASYKYGQYAIEIFPAQ